MGSITKLETRPRTTGQQPNDEANNVKVITHTLINYLQEWQDHHSLLQGSELKKKPITFVSHVIHVMLHLIQEDFK